MNDATTVRICDGLTNLTENAQKVRQVVGRTPALLEEEVEGLTLDQFHGEKGSPVLQAAGVVDRRDPRVLQLRGELRFFQKTSFQLWYILEIVPQDLEGEGAVEREVGDAQDHAHAAAGDLAVDP